MATDVMESVSSHLEYLGYKVTKTADGSLNAELLPSHVLKPNFSVHPDEGALLFMAGFSVDKPIKDAAEKSRLRLLEIINNGNLAAHVCRFTWNTDEAAIFAEGFYPSLYDKQTFAAFIETWLDEIALFFRSQRDELEPFLAEEPH